MYEAFPASWSPEPPRWKAQEKRVGEKRFSDLACFAVLSKHHPRSKTGGLKVNGIAVRLPQLAPNIHAHLDACQLPSEIPSSATNAKRKEHTAKGARGAHSERDCTTRNTKKISGYQYVSTRTQPIFPCEPPTPTWPLSSRSRRATLCPQAAENP